MKKPVSILFICTGNVFRSLVAEYALKALLGPEAGIVVGSAGIEALPQTAHPLVVDHLRARGADPSQHVQQKLTAELLAGCHMPVAMGLDHRDFIRRRFNRDVQLFNEICFQRTEPVLDIHEAVPDWQTNPEAARAHAVGVIDHIWDAMPAFLSRVSALEPR